MLNSCLYFPLPVAMVTKMAKKNRLKIEKLLFEAKFEDFGDRFFKNKISAQANTKKTF